MELNGTQITCRFSSSIQARKKTIGVLEFAFSVQEKYHLGFTVSPVERSDDNAKHMVLVEYLYVLLWNSRVSGVSLRLELGVIRRFYAKKLPDNESSRPFFLCVYGLSQ